MTRKPDSTAAERHDTPRRWVPNGPLAAVPVPVPGVSIESRRVDWEYREGRSTLRPATPMTRGEFDDAVAAYAATVDWAATTAEAINHAAAFGLVLEVVQ